MISEAEAGTSTTTSNDCAGPGPGTTLCEISDGSSDTFVSVKPSAACVQVSGLALERNDVEFPAPSITASWNPSCNITDMDYEVYEGKLGTWHSHTSPPSGEICSVSGGTTVTFDTGADDSYHLVVPRSDLGEGSYGRDSDGLERPASTTPCTLASPGGPQG